MASENSTTDGADAQSTDGIKRKPDCEMPDCDGMPEHETHPVRDPEGEVLKMCDNCLDDGWRGVVEVLD